MIQWCNVQASPPFAHRIRSVVSYVRYLNTGLHNSLHSVFPGAAEQKENFDVAATGIHHASRNTVFSSDQTVILNAVRIIQ